MTNWLNKLKTYISTYGNAKYGVSRYGVSRYGQGTQGGGFLTNKIKH